MANKAISNFITYLARPDTSVLKRKSFVSLFHCRKQSIVKAIYRGAYISHCIGRNAQFGCRRMSKAMLLRIELKFQNSETNFIYEIKSNNEEANCITE